jgi:hypothetical protein
MALNDVTFIKGKGGLGRPLAGEDHISGLVFYLADGNLPTGFSVSDRIKQVFSIADAETLGITKGSATNGVLWYHINEYFRIQPQGQLYIGIFDNAAIDYSVIEEVQNFADGKIRQIGVFDRTAFTTGTIGTLQTSCDTLEADHKPLSVIYGSDISGTADLSTLPDLTTLNAKNVSVTIGQDGANEGAALAVTEAVSITDLGAVLGAVSLSKVNESIEWIEKFNLTDGNEFNVPAFGNGDLVKSKASSFLVALKNKGYMFLKKHVGLAGSYEENGATSIAVTSDYAKIENNRTIDKATRSVRTFMLPNVASPVLVTAEGTLTESTVAKFKNDAARGLEQMERDEEISAFNVIIDPTQDILATSKLIITIQIVPVGVARQIEINIGFTVSVA